MTRWLYDTGVWLDIGFNRPAARKAIRLLADRRHTILSSAVSLAEIASVLRRRGAVDRVDQVLDLVKRVSVVLDVPSATFERAGHIHGRERAHSSRVSLADAILLAQAQTESARLLTKDGGLLRNHEGVKATRL